MGVDGWGYHSTLGLRVMKKQKVRSGADNLEASDRDARPSGHDPRHVRFGHLVSHHRLPSTLEHLTMEYI